MKNETVIVIVAVSKNGLVQQSLVALIQQPCIIAVQHGSLLWMTGIGGLSGWV